MSKYLRTSKTLCVSERENGTRSYIMLILTQNVLAWLKMPSHDTLPAFNKKTRGDFPVASITGFGLLLVPSGCYDSSELLNQFTTKHCFLSSLTSTSSLYNTKIS